MRKITVKLTIPQAEALAWLAGERPFGDGEAFQREYPQIAGPAYRALRELRTALIKAKEEATCPRK